MPKHIKDFIIKQRLAWFERFKRTGNVSEVCTYFGISRKTYYKWWNRYKESNFNTESLLDKSRRPKQHPKQLKGELVRLIKTIRARRKKYPYGPKLIRYFLEKDFGVKYLPTAAAIGKCLKREGLIEKPKRRKKNFKVYSGQVMKYPGQKIQVDVKHLDKMEGKSYREYQYTAKDCYSKVRFTVIYDSCNPQNSLDFIKRAEKFFPFKVEEWQFDNGTEFTYRMFAHIKKDHPLEAYLKRKNYKYDFIPLATPRFNGVVERSHRSDDEDLYVQYDFNNMKRRKIAAKAYLRKYNEQRPHMFFNQLTKRYDILMTPIDRLKSYHGFEKAELDYSVTYVCG